MSSETLRVGDVSQAWLVWSGAAETAQAYAYRFAGSPIPVRGLVVGRGSARFRVVKLGGPNVRKARGVAGVHEAADVFLYRDSSVAPLLDLRRRIKAVVDVPDAMIRNGFRWSDRLNLQFSGSAFFKRSLFLLFLSLENFESFLQASKIAAHTARVHDDPRWDSNP